MKPFLITVVLFMHFLVCRSQELSIQLGYDYMYSRQLDKAIQTYNFTRPFLTEKQPLLIHGLQIGSGIWFNSTKNWKSGIEANYSSFRSSVQNTNYSNIFNFQILHLNYIIHYQHPEKFRNMYMRAAIGITSSLLNRKINEEYFRMDDKKVRSWGIGGGFGFTIGYHLYFKNGSCLSPFTSVLFSPLVYALKNEAVLNATSGITGKPWMGILQVQFGMGYKFALSKNS